MLRLSLGNPYLHHFSSQNRLATSLASARKDDSVIGLQACAVILDRLEGHIHFVNDRTVRDFFFKARFDDVSFALKK